MPMTSQMERSAPGWQQLAAQQDDVVSRRQARLGGMTEDAWQWKLDKGLWRALLPGVVITHSGEPTDRQRAWGAVLRAGDGAALTADAALQDQGFVLQELRSVDVAVPEGRAGVGSPLLGGAPYRPHNVRRLSAMIHPVRPLPVVRVAPAALHAAAWAVSDRAAEWRVAAVVQQRLCSPADLRRALADASRLHRRALIGLVLDDVELGAHAGSELDFLRLCRRNALPEPDELQVRVRANKVRYIDARYRRQRVSIEVDGAHHRFVEQWEADVLRASELAVAGARRGEVLLRFAWGNLRHDESDVVRLIRQALG